VTHSHTKQLPFLSVTAVTHDTHLSVILLQIRIIENAVTGTVM